MGLETITVDSAAAETWHISSLQERRGYCRAAEAILKRRAVTRAKGDGENEVKYRLKEPSDEVVRISNGLVKLTWLKFATYGYDDETIHYLEVGQCDDWNSAPDGAQQWFSSQAWVTEPTNAEGSTVA